jgi:hypothetical protein
VRRVTLAAIGIAAFFAVIVLPRATLPMADGDAWWHIHAGEEILATGRVPTTNTWTIAGEGFRWVSQDWLSNTIMAGLHGAGPWGVGLLSLFFAGIVVGAFALLWRAVRQRAHHVGWLARMLWLTAGLIVAGPIMGIRVQTVDLLLTAATVVALWAFVGRPSIARGAALPLIAVLWVNLHAGWVMLFLLGGAVVAGEALDSWRGRDFEPPPLRPRHLLLLTGALVLAALALVVNPNGVAIWAYPFATASIQAHRDFLVEWSPPNPLSFEGQATLAFLAVVVLPCIILRWRAMRTSDLLWLVGLSLLALSAVRFALVLGPVGATLAAIQLSPAISRSAVGARLGPLVGRLSRSPTGPVAGIANLALMAIVLAGGVGIAIARAAPATQASAIASSVPMRAADEIARSRPRARIFNSYSWGGYLALALPDARVYIDGRSDLYGNEVIQRYASALTLSSDPGSLLEEAGIDTVLVKPSAEINRWLADHAAWSTTYADAISVLWVRASTEE